ncbi:Protein of unknown function [Gryllus bimaculatus]|nr:Protein of unknown function [Gryllus bimaculatus]
MFGSIKIIKLSVFKSLVLNVWMENNISINSEKYEETLIHFLLFVYKIEQNRNKQHNNELYRTSTIVKKFNSNKSVDYMIVEYTCGSACQPIRDVFKLSRLFWKYRLIIQINLSANTCDILEVQLFHLKISIRKRGVGAAGAAGARRPEREGAGAGGGSGGGGGGRGGAAGAALQPAAAALARR